MDRMGHDSERAAMIYLHGSAKRRQAIADTLSQLASEELKRGSKRNAARPRGSRSGTEAPRGFLTVEGRPGEPGLTSKGSWAPRARLERATYCLGGTTAPALCRPATTHVTTERNSHRQLLSERSCAGLGPRLRSPVRPPPATSTR
jgi:hypothetical protein